MKVRFIRDKEYDGFMIWQLLKSEDPMGAKNRAKLMKISDDQIEKIRRTKSLMRQKTMLEKWWKNDIGNTMSSWKKQ